ncbi:hypothetical protein CB1_000999008 [Camelus ferus]|nr:hypothetical protein CB1_000999008 [Camelus ferus]
MGMPFTQLGVLTGSKFYDIEATYFYQRCLHAAVPFKGASWNLKHLYDHAGKRYSRLKRYQGKKLTPSQRRCWDNKRLLVSFLYRQSFLQPQRKFRATRLMALCRLVLEDFRLCLSYQPCPSDLSWASGERKPLRGYLFLPDLLIFRMLPEDIALGQYSPRPASQERVGLEQDPPPLSSQNEAAVHICFLRSFGHFATTIPGQFLRFDSTLEVFVSSGLGGPVNPSQQFLERISRIRFSKDIIQLWLQCEVVELEKTLRHLQIQLALTPYLFPDPRPSIVVGTLYVLRREDCPALAAVTFLEDELKRGNQYILCQSLASTSFVRPRMMTRPDSDAWDPYNILDFCKGLLGSSQPGDPNLGSMITIIKGICLDNPRNFSYPLQVALGMATEAGVEINNVRRFLTWSVSLLPPSAPTRQTQFVHLSC